MNVPILKGVPFFEELTLDGSARAFDYDCYGSDSVWKAGLNWQVIPSLRFRGTHGHLVSRPGALRTVPRQPDGLPRRRPRSTPASTGATHQPQHPGQLRAAGIPANYTGVGSSALIITGGGAGVLEAETSDANTLGVIWTPDFIDLSLAIDYFDITINDQVAQLGAGSILGGCYGSPVFPNGVLRPVHP